jgi:hypothetical protein
LEQLEAPQVAFFPLSLADNNKPRTLSCKAASFKSQQIFRRVPHETRATLFHALLQPCAVYSLTCRFV